MAVYGGIQAHELERWLNALTNAAYDRRCPLSKVHGGNARARTARQDLLHLAHGFRSGERIRDDVADGLSRWCQHYLTEAEWYVLVGGRQPAEVHTDASTPTVEAPAIDEPVDNDDVLHVLYQHRVG
ncbi:MAG: hypothetical protein ACQEUK_13440 [Pseudomonadota bacterium]